MAEFTSHAPGTFSWVELATSDPKAGVAFYRGLFGWDVVEHDMGPSGVYTIFTNPTGAVLQLWEPKAHIGVKIRNEPNTLCWSELTTKDPKARVAWVA